MGNMNVTVIDQNNVTIAVTPTPTQTINIDRGLLGPSGWSGYSGTSGFSGNSTSGYSGYSGAVGQSGYSGFSGQQGTSINVKGEVPTVGDLPPTGNQVNDAYIVTADGNLWVWNGSAWYDAGQIVGPQGLSGYSGYSGDSTSGYSGYSGETVSGYSGYSGIGESGYSGFSGETVSGYSGYSGDSTSGFSGYSGATVSGYSGYSGSGVSGFSGSGISGYSGFSGATVSGYSGYSGSGISGYSGSGVSGFSGYSGSGVSGYSGYSGSGLSGFSGSGVSGFSGFSGSGVSGYSGYSGIATSGYSGYSGIGTSGYSGYSGAVGAGGTIGNWGSFWDTTTQTTTINTATPITFNSYDLDNTGVSIGSPTSRIVFANSGTYSLTFSIQFTNTSTANGSTQIWLKKNGTNIPDTNSHFDVPDKQGSAFSSEILTVNFVFNVTANDYVQLYWDTTNANVSLETIAGNGTYPRTPSVIFTATQVMYGQSGYSGISGYSGNSTSGYSGYSGSGISGYSGSGISGYSGATVSGYSGYSGSGISGFSGSGISGYSGFSGQTISGYSGYSGSGISGYSGSGVSGFSGYSGSGLSGFSGYSGSGISGYSGSGVSGFSGFSGSGISGFSGIGTSGYSGYSGITPTIGGSNTQVQFNNSGVLGGSANLVFDGSTLTASNGNGAAGLIVNSSANTPYLRFDQSNASKFTIGESSIVGGGGTGYYDFYATTGLGQRFFAGASEKLRITTSNYIYTASGVNVGIGVSNPTAKLDVLNTYVSDATVQARIRDNTGYSLNFTGTASGFKALQVQDSTGSALYTSLLLNPLGGNVGIGTSSPANKLSIADNSASAMIYGLQSGAGDLIALANSASEKFRITNDGNVGIGESSPSSYGKLAVYGGSANTIVSIKTNSFDGTYYAGLNFSTGGQGANDPQAQIKAVGANNYSADLIFSTQTSGTTNPLVEKMRILSTGNVGINAISPVAKLQIKGSGTSGQVSASFILENSSSGTGGMDITGSAGASRWRFLYGGGPSTGTNALTEAMCINTEGVSSGNVGINESNPPYKLTVAGTGYFQGPSSDTAGQAGLFINYGNASGVVKRFLCLNGNGVTNAALGLNQIDASNGELAISTLGSGTLTDRVRVTSTGHVTVGATSFASSSPITAGLLAGNFRSIYATTTVGALSTATILTLSSSATGVYIVQANFGGQGNEIYGGMLIVVANLGSFRIVTNGSGANCALTLSGANVQITNALGVALDATGTAILIGNGN